MLPAIKANALYGGGYPLFTALGRPLIAKLAVEHARRTGCDTIAHGCTGKGNDQVRIEATVATLDPELKVIAPVREWQMGREEEIAYAREHGIPVKGGTEAPPYSIDDNLWGRSSEGGAIEDLDQPPRDDVFQLVTRPEEAPDEPEAGPGRLRARLPRSRSTASASGWSSCSSARPSSGAATGSGSSTTIEDRIVGLKIRDLYEVPAAAIVLAAHRELEKLVSTIHQNNFKRALEDKWAYLCYAGLWHEPLRADLDAYMESANELRHRRGHAEALQGLGDAGGAQLAVRALRPLAGLVRRVGRRVQPGREPRVHRAVHAAEPDGAAPEGSAPATSGPEGPSPDKSGRMGGTSDDDDLPAVGRFMVRYWLVNRYRRQIRIARGRCNGGCAAAGYAIATRQPPEG